jgi:predicted metal-dependent phosphotriesterase family hydrolase
LWLKQELTEGLDGTTAKPGLLTCAMQNDADSLKASFRLAAEYQRQTGLPVMLRERAATAAFQLPEAAIEKGIAASQLVVRSDSWSKFEARADDIVQLGSYLLVDGLGNKARGSDLKMAELVARLVEHGYRNQILLSHGFDRRSLLTGYDGRPGYGYIIEQFAIMLLEAGVAAPDVRVMLVDNCASALSVQPHGSELDA